jgi:hypothetical protein
MTLGNKWAQGDKWCAKTAALFNSHTCKCKSKIVLNIFRNV